MAKADESTREYSVGETFEFLLAEWGLTPEYILHNWTDEELDLMIEKLNKRKQHEFDAIRGRNTSQFVSDKELFTQLGNKVKVVKR